MKKLIKLGDNLRLAICEVPTVRSVACGVFVGVGSVNESDNNNGISHFLEHMMFKGTNKRNSFEIVHEIDNMGAQINAFTSKQLTCYYVISTDEHTEDSIEVLSDITTNSIFPQEEIEKERGVILSEIDMNEDSPEDVVMDLVSAEHFKGSTIAYTILGPKDNIKSITRQNLVDYYNEHYTSGNIVISIVGNITVDKAIELCNKYFVGKFSKSKMVISKEALAKPVASVVTKRKEIEQANVCLCYKGVDLYSNDTYATTILNLILGGGMSSRLFQRVREKLGLVYTIYSYPSSYLNNGSFNIYFATGPDQAKQAIEAVLDEIDVLVNNGISKEEFLRAREQVKGTYILGLESTSSMMRLLGRYAVQRDALYDVDEYLEKYNELSVQDINRVAKKIFNNESLTIGYVGKDEDILLDTLL